MLKDRYMYNYFFKTHLLQKDPSLEVGWISLAEWASRLHQTLSKVCCTPLSGVAEGFVPCCKICFGNSSVYTQKIS